MSFLYSQSTVGSLSGKIQIGRKCATTCAVSTVVRFICVCIVSQEKGNGTSERRDLDERDKSEVRENLVNTERREQRERERERERETERRLR